MSLPKDPHGDSQVTRLLRWQAGEKPGPWEVSVFPTNRCNLACKICWLRWALKEFGDCVQDPAGELSDDRLLRLVDEGAEMGVRQWTIVGGGEPMTRGKVVMEMCERIRALGMEGTLHTNATMFSKKQLQQLVDIGWPRLQVSLDGPEAEINDAIRSPGSFERATANLRALRDMRRDKGVTLPLVSLHPVITRMNVDKLDRMYELAAELECTGCSVSHLQVAYENCVPFDLAAEQRERLPEYLMQARRRASELGLQHNLDLFIEGESESLPQEPDMPEPILNARCYEPWLTAVITNDGRVGPCCVFDNDVEAESLRDMSLREAWTGTYMERARKVILKRGMLKYCQQCPSYILPRMMNVRWTYVQEHLPLTQGDSEPRAYEGMSWRQWAGTLAGRTWSTLREQGMAGTVRRAREWYAVHVRRR